MPEPPAECGTMPGWRRHKRMDTQPCQACLCARADYDSDQKLASWRRAVLDAEVAIFEKRRQRPTPDAWTLGPEWEQERAMGADF